MTDETSKDEQKTERFNMFMSPSEMKAIDDWAWQVKIRSKSEAVRRLCQIGLLVSGELEGLADSTSELSGAMHQLDQETFHLWANILSPFWKGETLDRAAVASVLKTLVSNVSEVDAGVDNVSTVLVGLFSAVAGIARAGSSAEGRLLADKAIEDTKGNLARMREIQAQIAENRKKMGEVDYSDSWKTEGEEK